MKLVLYVGENFINFPIFIYAFKNLYIFKFIISTFFKTLIWICLAHFPVQPQRNLPSFNLKLKKLLCCFWDNPLGFFIILSADVFLFNIYFYYCFQVFSLLIPFIYFIVFWDFFVSSNFFTVTAFCDFAFCVVLQRVLRIGERFFYSQVFFTLHSFSTFGTTCCHQGFPGAGSSTSKDASSPTEVRNTDLALLFVWIIECSAKGLSR